MVIHKCTRLTPFQRQEIYKSYYDDRKTVSALAEEYHVSRPTIYKILRRGRSKDFTIHRSTNKRFRCLPYGIKRLAKVEDKLEARRKAEAKRYNKDYPGQMLHGDTKRLPLLEGQTTLERREYLFVAIDDFSRELYAAILPDKTQVSAKAFLEQVLDECPYTIEQYYTDNGKEYKGDPRNHAFMKLCAEHHIEQRFTLVRNPKTNGKAERVIKTLIELWHDKTRFNSSAHRKSELKRFLNFYNGVRPHKGIGGLTPEEKLIEYFYPEKL
ncbi:IS481 family transposase [bacterium]|nr:MAG: IS481 family transposase [bacterium]